MGQTDAELRIVEIQARVQREVDCYCGYFLLVDILG